MPYLAIHTQPTIPLIALTKGFFQFFNSLRWLIYVFKPVVNTELHIWQGL